MTLIGWLDHAQSLQLPKRLVLDAILRATAMACLLLHILADRLAGLGVSRIVLAARLLGSTVLLDITNQEVIQDDLEVAEVLIRWCAISLLAIPTFEEQTLWACLVMGLSLLQELLETEEQNMSKVPLVLGSLSVLISYWYISSKRDGWFKGLATSTSLVDENLQGKQVPQQT